MIDNIIDCFYKENYRHDNNAMNTLKKLLHVFSPYSLTVFADRTIYDIMVKNEEFNDNCSSCTVRWRLSSIRNIKEYFTKTYQNNTHGDWFMRKMSLLEVIEFWMLEPEKEFEDSVGDVYHMNKYGLIEDRNGSVKRHPNIMKQDWMPLE